MQDAMHNAMGSAMDNAMDNAMDPVQSTRHPRHLTLRDHVPGWNLAGNEPGASCDGDSGPQGAHVDPKPGNHPELGSLPPVSRTATSSAAPPAAPSPRRRPSAAPPA
jgi:hypothetical protein